MCRLIRVLWRGARRPRSRPGPPKRLGKGRYDGIWPGCLICPLLAAAVCNRAAGAFGRHDFAVWRHALRRDETTQSKTLRRRRFFMPRHSHRPFERRGHHVVHKQVFVAKAFCILDIFEPGLEYCQMMSLKLRYQAFMIVSLVLRSQS